MKPVIAPPLLPYPSGNSISSLSQFDADLRRAMVEILTQYAFRINGSLPADGSEPMTGPLTINAPGTLRIENNTDVSSLTQTDAPVQIGSYGAVNVIMDGNEIQARNNGAASSLNLQLLGDIVRIGPGGLSLDSFIKFPATQVPSADANTLDDYEENTWTPAFAFSGGNTGITYSTQVGVYVKIGQLVFVQGRVILTSKGSSTGQARITNLPFSANGASHNYTPISVGYYQSFVGLTGALTGYVEINSTFINLVMHGATGVSATLDTNISNTTDIIFSAVYRAGA